MEQKKLFETDVAIIGAGPVGLFAIFQCGMLGMKCHVIDSLDSIGGQCSALYPEKPIYDIPAYPNIQAEELITKLEQQAAPFDPQYHFNQSVVAIRKQSSHLILDTSIGTNIKAKAVIIAAGAGVFGPNKPPLEHLESYEGISVFYMVRHKKDYEGKNIVIAGGGDSAVDWALSLCDIAKNTYLVHRRDKFRAMPDSVEKLRQKVDEGKVQLIVPYQLKALEGKKGKLSTVRVASKQDEKEIKADILLPFFGLKTSLEAVETWQLDIIDDKIVVDPATLETSQSKIYAIGDIVSYKNKLKLILTGFSDAAMASHDIYRQLNPDQPLHFEYSTTKGLPNIV